MTTQNQNHQQLLYLSLSEARIICFVIANGQFIATELKWTEWNNNANFVGTFLTSKVLTGPAEVRLAVSGAQPLFTLGLLMFALPLVDFLSLLFCLCDGHLGIAYANMLATTPWPLERAAHLTSLVWVCVLWLPESLMDLSALWVPKLFAQWLKLNICLWF